MRKSSLLDLFGINAYWLGLSFMWNSLHLLILPAVLLHYVPDTQKNTYLGLLTFAGLVIAMLVQPVSGAWSDRWRSGWGRRRPLILLGTIFDFVFLGMLAWAGGIPWLAVGYLGLQLSSNLAHGPLQGLLPDRTPKEQLGTASSMKNFFDMAALVAASLFMGRFLDPQARHPVSALAIVALVLAIPALVTLLFAGEASTKDPRLFERERSHPQAEPRVEPGDPERNRRYAWLIASRLAFLLGIYNIQAFAQYYVKDVLAPPNAVKLTGDLMAAITLALIAFALLGGWLGDRLGHKRVLLVASLVGAVGCLLMLWARTPQTLLAYGSVAGAGTGLFLTANWALANQLSPPAHAGKFLGLTNLATAGAGAISRLIGPGVDLLNNASPGLYQGYTFLFALGAICMLVSAVLLRFISLPQPHQKASQRSTRIEGIRD
jgi:MFS family permease